MRFPFKIPANKKFDVIGFGTNAVDYLIQAAEFPAFNSKIELTDYYQAAGGEIATTLTGLARLGLKTGYAGHFGGDREGDFGLQSLRGENVNTDFAERVADAKTQIAFIIIDGRNGERTVLWQRDKKLSYTKKDAPIAAARLGKVLHFTPHDAEACLAMAEAAKAAGAIISIDADNLFTGIKNLLPLVDLLICSAELPEKLTGIKNLKKSLREINRRYGCAVVGVTLGKHGSLLLCENKFIETESFAVPGGCRDTTGAGDAFRAGLLYGLLTGAEIETSAQMANAVAALKCRAVGAQTALPNQTELLDLLKRHSI